MDGRPIDEYIASNVESSFASASSASRLMSRIGCVAGTRFPGDVVVNSSIWESCSPRMPRADHTRDRLSIPRTDFFSSLLGPPASDLRINPVRLRSMDKAKIAVAAREIGAACDHLA